MKKRSLILMLTLALSFGARAVQLARADSGDSDNGRPPRVIRLVERIHDFTIQDFGTPGVGLGDRIVLTSDLFNEAGHLVGRDGADCVVVRIDPTAPLPE